MIMNFDDTFKIEKDLAYMGLTEVDDKKRDSNMSLNDVLE